MKTFDFKQVQLIIGGRIISGFAEGTAIRVGRDADSWSKTIGADGEGARSKSNNKAGFIEFDLLQTAESNRVLSDLSKADEANNSGLVPGLLKDNSGNSIVAVEQGYVLRPADGEYGAEITNRTWRFETDVLENYNGGN